MLNRFQRILYPRRCPICGCVIADDMLICADCRHRPKKVRAPFCMKCGRHTDSEERELCHECSRKEHHYSFGVSVFEYDALMKQSMADYKFHGHRENADYYVDEAVKEVGSRIRSFDPDILVPVPVHRSRRLYRGYNQAEILAKGIGASLDIPVREHLLIRKRRTTFQKRLGAKDRRSNISKAFTCDPEEARLVFTESKQVRVMIVDDIYTTGSTMEECTKALIDAGAKEVGILSICIGQGY